VNTRRALADRRMLDHARCATPGCAETHGPLYLHSRCHPNAAVEVCYEAGILTIRCKKCQTLVIEVSVATEIA